MLTQLRKNASLMIGFGILLVGHGLLGTLLGVRAGQAGFGSDQIGVVMAGYFVGYIVGSRFSPGLISRVGHIRWFAAMASAASAAVIAHGLVVHPAAWFLFRALSGFCMVSLYIAIESWLNHQTDSRTRGSVFSVYLTVNMLAMGAGQLLLRIPTDQPFLLYGLISVLMSLGVVPIALTRLAEPVLRQRVPKVRLRNLFRASPLGVAGTATSGVINGTFYGLGPVFLTAMGLGVSDVAEFMATVILGGALSLFVVGRLSDRIDRRKVLITVLFLTTATAFGMLSVGRYDLLATPLLLLYGACSLNIYSLSASHLNDHLKRSQVLGATSKLQTIFGVGSIVGPVTAGLLMSGLGAPAFVGLISGTALLVALFGWYRMTRRGNVPLGEQGQLVPASRTPSTIITMAIRAPDLADGEVSDDDLSAQSDSPT